MLAVEDAWIPAGKQVFVEGRGMPGESVDFREGERQQVMHRRSTGQRLTHRCQQQQILRAREYPATRRGQVVDNALEVGEEVGYALHFVDDRAFRKLPQEPARVSIRKRARVGGFQSHVGKVRKKRAAQCGLAALTRTGNGNRRRLRRCVE